MVITTRETLPGLCILIGVIGVSVTVTDICIRGCVRVGFIKNNKVMSTSEGWTIGSVAINLVLFGLVFQFQMCQLIKLDKGDFLYQYSKICGMYIDRWPRDRGDVASDF